MVTLPNINFYNELESGQVNTKNNADGLLNAQENEQNNMDDQFNESISELG